jgi:hypothetical protein
MQPTPSKPAARRSCSANSVPDRTTPAILNALRWSETAFASISSPDILLLHKRTASTVSAFVISRVLKTASIHKDARHPTRSPQSMQLLGLSADPFFHPSWLRAFV